MRRLPRGITTAINRVVDAAEAVGECQGLGHGEGWGDPNNHDEGDHCVDRGRELEKAKKALRLTIAAELVPSGIDDKEDI